MNDDMGGEHTETFNEDVSLGGPDSENPTGVVGVFICQHPSCDKRFTTKFSLKRHYYIHSRKKTFPCQYCNKVFALPQYLREH